ncbi:NUDIX hydrolase [Arvimicrobium flavum]|uniref:NUDIX hydrolase n=1 Tax=Arvimicrobium flavum TaxID=3393320 RepID=UPI00237A3417|nr:NUDIX hydrolase [Mesorhizobium shangrilense]
MAFDIPRGVIVPVTAVEVKLQPDPHPFELQHRQEIADNWRRISAQNPALFDGRVVLLSELSYRGGKVVGKCHEIGFSTFMFWRDHDRSGAAEHAYAHAALVSSDNQLIAIRMGAQTANAGMVYFAAGSFEPVDFPGGMVDVDANMIREVREETGLDISRLRRDPAYHLYSLESGSVIVRRYYLDEPADVIARRIEAFVASEVEPEIDGPVLICSAENLPDGVKPHMAEIVRWHFRQDD